MEEKNEMSIKDRLVYNNNKLVADKIRKTLLNIRNIPGISAKRWIWELIQNAKDVPNNFGKVDIRIELNTDSLIFSHNGTYFKVDNILGLLQQVSSKDSLNQEDQTGKFGTGFIGTHLLSEQIELKGVVKYCGIFRKFVINLDRTSKSSEELLKKVSESILEFEKNMTEENSKYEKMRTYKQKQGDFDTSFKYILNNKESLQFAKDGINDLINTAPVTLSAQFKKIGYILVKNNITQEEIKYTIDHKEKDKTIDEKGEEKIICLNTIKIESNKNGVKYEYFYSIENNSCLLIYQVDKKENGFCAVERKENQPILLRDFPLIGSENFHFPFFLDGFKFQPLETRNGLYLNGNIEEALENRKIIEDAIELSNNFSKWLFGQNIDKRYILADTKIPEPPQKYDDIAIDWFIKQQKKWRKEIIKYPILLDVDSSYNQLNKLKLPQFRKEYNEDFYNIINEVNLSGGILPKNYKKWYNIMEVDPLKEVYKIKENTWVFNDFNYLFTEKDLFEKISSIGTISKLSEKINKDNKTVIDWLNNIYKFLKKYNYKDCLNEYAIIPNQNGNFKKIGDLFGNKEEDTDEIYEISDLIKLVYKEVFNKEIDDIIIHEDIDLSSFGESIKIKNNQKIFNEFSDFMKQNNRKKNKKQKNSENKSEKMEYLCNEFISFNIDNEKIDKMFNFRKDTVEKYKNEKKVELKNYFEKKFEYYKSFKVVKKLYRIFKK